MFESGTYLICYNNTLDSYIVINKDTNKRVGIGREYEDALEIIDLAMMSKGSQVNHSWWNAA